MMAYALNLFRRGGCSKFAVIALAIVVFTAKVDAVEPVLTAKEQVVAKLRGLKSNEAVLLGNAAIVGEFNDTARQYNLHKTGPRGRDFTIKMCWAPERKRALFCGANHGSPHRLNDVWEFDLPSLTWVMLYAPDLPRGYGDLGKDFSDVEFKDGVLVTKRSGPAVIAHTWWGLTYEPQHKALLFMNTWVTKREKAVADLGGNVAELYKGPPLWAFYPESRTWKAMKTPKPYPRPMFGGMLEYIPDLKGSIWHSNNWQMRATWLHDYQTNTWKDLKANTSNKTKDNAKANNNEKVKDNGKAFEAAAPQPEQIGYYDAKRKQIIVQRHFNTHHFDLKTNAWKLVLTGNQDDGKTPYGHDARAVFYRDPVSGQGLLVQLQTNTIWAYNPDSPAWTKLSPQGDPMPTGRKRLAYIDPAMNVVVVIEDTKVWAFRFKDK